MRGLQYPLKLCILTGLLPGNDLIKQLWYYLLDEGVGIDVADGVESVRWSALQRSSDFATVADAKNVKI